MKKKPEIRFNNEGCSCRTDLFMKEDYFVFGKHVLFKGKIEILEVNRDSFVTEWKDTLEKEIEQLEGYCSRSSLIPTPLIPSTATLSKSTSLQFVKKETTAGMLSLKENLSLDSIFFF